jgi:hypothetical protein
MTAALERTAELLLGALAQDAHAIVGRNLDEGVTSRSRTRKRTTRPSAGTM